MSTPSGARGPLSADEILAAIVAMPIPERTAFFQLLEDNFRMFHGTGFVIIPKEILDLQTKAMDLFRNGTFQFVDLTGQESKRVLEMKKQAEELSAEIKRRQRPSKLVERDAEIETLLTDGLKPSQIVNRLKSRYPNITQGVIRNVKFRQKDDD